MTEETVFNATGTSPLQLQERVEQIMLHLQKGETTDAADILKVCPPIDIARIIEALPEHERATVWQELDVAEQTGIMPNLSATVRVNLVRAMPLKSLVSVAENLPADDAADVLQALPRKSATAVLEKLSPEADQQLTPIVSLPANQAGGLMNTDITCVRANVKLGTVINMLRDQGSLPTNTDQLFVTGKNKKYLGSLPVTTLLTTKSDSLVKNCMVTDSSAITVDWPLEKVTAAFIDGDLLSAPVVDNDGAVIGRITVDDVNDVINRQIGDTMLKMGGLPNEDDLFAPLAKSAWRRSIWLCTNLFTAFLASWVIGWFEEGLNQIVALAILMPVVASMGGVAGSQTLTVTIRGLALGQLGRANTRFLIYKELGVALANGIVWMVLATYIAMTWFNNFVMALIFGFSILVNLIAAAAAGVIIPLAMRKMRIDPAIAGSVVLTTVTDVVGFITFLGLGSFILLSG